MAGQIGAERGPRVLRSSRRMTQGHRSGSQRAIVVQDSNLHQGFTIPSNPRDGHLTVGQQKGVIQPPHIVCAREGGVGLHDVAVGIQNQGVHRPINSISNQDLRTVQGGQYGGVTFRWEQGRGMDYIPLSIQHRIVLFPFSRRGIPVFPGYDKPPIISCGNSREISIPL